MIHYINLLNYILLNNTPSSGHQVIISNICNIDIAHCHAQNVEILMKLLVDISSLQPLSVHYMMQLQVQDSP